MTSVYFFIHLIYALLLSTWETKLLRFKNNVKNFDKDMIKVYGTQRRKDKYIKISPKNL